jgi:hypothetical protein
MQAVSAQGSRHCALMLELLVQTLDGIYGPQRFPLFGRVVQEGEETRSGLLQTGGDSGTVQPPFAHERLVSGDDLGDRCRVDHIGVDMLER